MKTLFGNACQGWQGEASADPEEVRRRLDMEWGLAQGPITELDCPTGAACHWFSSFTHMAINPDSVLDNLTRLVQVIGPDRKLRQWFSALAEKSAVERRNEIYLACERMQTAGQDADLAVSLRLLADARVFTATAIALQAYDNAG